MTTTYRNRYQSRPSRVADWAFDNAVLVFGAIVGLFVLGGLVFGIVNATHVEHKTCTVTDKDRTRGSEGKSDMRLYTEECGVLQVHDSLLSFTWSSSDTYNEAKPGQTYDVTTRGYRIPFLSMFPNVVDLEPVE